MLDDNTRWYHLSLCKNMPLNWFYDEYESDPVMAETMDKTCMVCPVRKQCLREGVEQKNFGLWGGVFLNNGQPDKRANAHKTDDIWGEIRESLVD